MKILILGGTVFLGRALTDAALERGHVVTHFNRGNQPDKRVETLTGDRTFLTPLQNAQAGREWDAVVDTSGYLPQVVRRSAQVLRGSVHRYLFISTISVYDDAGFDEDAKVKPAPDPLPEAMTPETYGGLKAACEAVVRGEYGDRATLVRPGLIVGPHDPTDRFTWWPHRVALGGRVAAPGRPQRTVQLIDVRDLARWTIMLLEQDAGGTYNATGPERPIPMDALLVACREASGSDARFEWLAEEFLAAHDVKPWKDMPLWVPESDPKAAGFMNVPIQRALSTGLAFRPLAETIRDTLEWSRSRPADHQWKAGLDSRRENELLSKSG
jgi:2'-hydroxyisoflavone reductase